MKFCGYPIGVKLGSRRYPYHARVEADTMADGYSNIDNSRTVNDLDSSSSGDAYIFFSRNDVSVQEEKDDRDYAAKAGRFILKNKNLVIVFWLIALASTGYFATQLLTNTQLAFTPPYSSPAATSHRYFEKVCPVQAKYFKRAYSCLYKRR